MDPLIKDIQLTTYQYANKNILHLQEKTPHGGKS